LAGAVVRPAVAGWGCGAAGCGRQWLAGAWPQLAGTWRARPQLAGV
jgi:hypothetical protein